MLHVALWEPEIPPNTGNIARLCAANDIPLHLIGRIGFQLDNRHLIRAGCDYWPAVQLHRHDHLAQFQTACPDARIIPFSSRGTIPYTRLTYRPGDCLLFGSESRGLPASILAAHAPLVVTVPMSTRHVRSLNLATVVGIGLYEALRQLHNW